MQTFGVTWCGSAHTIKPLNSRWDSRCVSKMFHRYKVNAWKSFCFLIEYYPLSSLWPNITYGWDYLLNNLMHTTPSPHHPRLNAVSFKSCSEKQSRDLCQSATVEEKKEKKPASESPSHSSVIYPEPVTVQRMNPLIQMEGTLLCKARVRVRCSCEMF